MEYYLTQIAGKLWPDLDTLDEVERKRVAKELVGIIYGSLLAVVGLGWLVVATDLALLRSQWPTLLLMLILAVTLNQLGFFWVVERRAGIYDRWSTQLGGLVSISAALLFGPTALWLGALLPLVHYARGWRATPLPTQRVLAMRNLVLNVSSFSIGSLLGFTLYRELGGSFPPPGLAWPAPALAEGAVLTLLVFDWLCWTCYLLIVGYTPLSRAGDCTKFRAEMDLIMGLTACSAGQSNNFSYKPIHYRID